MADFLFYKRIRNGVVSLTDKFINTFSNKTIGKSTVGINEECRPDKLSYKWYNNPRYDWLILKYNGISNPYSLQEGMTYKVPDLTEVMNSMGYLSTPEVVVPVTDEKNKILAKQFNIDINKLAYNKKKRTTTKATPDNGVQIVNGRIVFGDNNSTQQNREVLSNVISASQGGTNTTTSNANQCGEICDLDDPELCKLCTCSAKPSDVLTYKILTQNRV